MVITRDGAEITLTPEELENAFMEYQHNEDVEYIFNELSSAEETGRIDAIPEDKKIELADELAHQYRAAFDDDRTVQNAGGAIARRLTDGNDTYMVSVAIDGRLDVEVRAGSFQEAFQKAVWYAGDVDWNCIECISINPVNAERERDREFRDYA